jgi:hypothetical protein
MLFRSISVVIVHAIQQNTLFRNFFHLYRPNANVVTPPRLWE